MIARFGSEVWYNEDRKRQMFGHDTIEMEGFMRMQAYRIEKTIPQNGNLQLTALPFQAGELVDIIILRREDQVRSTTSDLLKGTVLKYEDPTEPVALEDWDVLQ